MEIIIIWAIFIIIVIMNMNKAKKMQQERMQEHQRNMQEHNQNVPEYGSNMHRMQNNSSGNGSLSQNFSVVAYLIAIFIGIIISCKQCLCHDNTCH